MQLNTDLTGLIGLTLAIVALFARTPLVRALPLLKKAGALGAVIIVVSIPFWGLSLTGLLRGITGDLSIFTLVFLVMALTRSVSNNVLAGESNRHATLRAILIAAVLFYPLALGLGMFDPYRLGYGNLWFLLVLMGFAIWSSLRYSTLFALCIALAVAAWSVGWYESPNLWDYLLDPWLAIYAFAVQVKIWLVRWKGNIHA